MGKTLLFLTTRSTGAPTSSTVFDITTPPQKPNQPGVWNLEVSDAEFDEHSWFHKQIALSFKAHFSSGERYLHYHPGNLRNYLGSGMAFASFIGKIAVIGNAGYGLFKKSIASNMGGLTRNALALKATKRGFDVREDWNDVWNNLDDASVYPEEGYYDIGTRKLRIRGKIHPTDGYVIEA